MINGLGKRIRNYLLSGISTREEKQQLTMFLLSVITGILGFPMHILGVWGSSDWVLQGLSIAIFVGLAAMLTLYLLRKISLYWAFFGYGIVMQSTLSAKIIYIAVTMPAGASYLIIFNSFISMLVILVLAMGYMRHLPTILTIVSFATSVIARNIRPEVVQMQFLLFFIFIELFSCLLGFMAWRHLHEAEKENADFRDEEGKILKTLHMTKEELTAYLAMSLSDDHDPKFVRNIFDSLDERSEHNILKAVKEHEMEKRMQTVDISDAFPMLSATEQEVCRLILHGKTLREIATLLGKNTNNISSVRIHIRKKLGLTNGQDLRQYLMEKVKF